MPRNLSHRLQKLEKELQVLLMLQNVSCTNNTTMTRPISSRVCPAEPVEKIPPSEPAKPDRLEPEIVPLFPKTSGSTPSLNDRFEETRRKTYLKYMGFPTEPRQTLHEYSEHQCTKRPKRPHPYRPKSKSPPSKYIEDFQDDKGTETEYKNAQNDRDDHTDMVATKPLEDDHNKDLSQKYQELLKEISSEQAKRLKVEKAVGQLRNTLESNKTAIHDMIESKKLALDMAKQLREKYDCIRLARKETLDQLHAVKIENSTLINRLEAESQARQMLEKELRSLHEKECKSLHQLTQLGNQMGKLESRIEIQQTQLQQKEVELDQEKEKRRSKDDPELRALLDVEKKTYEQALNEKSAQVTMLQELIRDLEEQFKKLQEVHKNLKDDPQVKELIRQELSEVQKSLEQKTMQCKKMQTHCDKLEKMLEEVKELDRRKYLEAERQLCHMRDAMKAKEQLLHKERDELEHLVKELTEMVKQHKNRIIELTAINEQQEALVKTQNMNLASKEEHVKLANQEAELLRKKSFEMQMEIHQLVNTVQDLETVKGQLTVCAATSTCEDRKTQAALEREIAEWRASFNSECDKQRIQEKIIQDQNDTIHKLKMDKNDMKRDRDAYEHELDMEKQSRQKVMVEMTNLQRHNDHLLNRVERLEEEAIDAGQKPLQEMKRQQQLLANLEKQVQAKQSEWETQLKIMAKEKEQAVAAAQFATQKLMETVNEFQKQVSTQKKVQRMLTSLLSEKEEQILVANEKIAALTMSVATPIGTFLTY